MSISRTSHPSPCIPLAGQWLQQSGQFLLALATIAGLWSCPHSVLAQSAAAPEEGESYENLSVPELLDLIRQDLNRPDLPPASDLSPAESPLQLEVTDTADRLKRYRLGPDDVILVTVARFPDFNFQGPINPEGAIVLPLVNVLSLEGLTLGEAQEKIRQALDRYIVDPQISLSLISQRPVQVTVVGSVTRPGFYPLATPRISDALLAAGGSLASADLRKLEVRRTLADGTVLSQTLDLYTPLKDGLPIPNQRLEDGDVVMLPELETLEDPSYDRRLVAISTLAKPTINVRLLSYASNGIGTLTLPSGSYFRDALNGIPLDSANINSIALIRYDPETGQAIKTKVDGKQILLGDPEANLALQDNDVIVVGRNLVTKISTLLNRFTQPFRDALGFILFFDSLQQNAEDLFRSGGR
ncbi:MAG: polysaccharide biosynthesis/export family protein [Prochlorotrichaceae cyanobacterium]